MGLLPKTQGASMLHGRHMQLKEQELLTQFQKIVDEEEREFIIDLTKQIASRQTIKRTSLRLVKRNNPTPTSGLLRGSRSI